MPQGLSGSQPQLVEVWGGKPGVSRDLGEDNRRGNRQRNISTGPMTPQGIAFRTISSSARKKSSSARRSSSSARREDLLLETDLLIHLDEEDLLLLPEEVFSFRGQRSDDNRLHPSKEDI